MDEKFSIQPSANVSVNIPLNAAGNIAQEGDTTATQKSFSMNFFNAQQIITGTMGQDAATVHENIGFFCEEFWVDIFGTSFDSMSLKAKIDLETTLS